MGSRGRDPTGRPCNTPADLRSAGSRRRRGPRPRGEHQRAPRSEAHLEDDREVPLDRPEDDRKTSDEHAWRHGDTARRGQAAPVR